MRLLLTTAALLALLLPLARVPAHSDPTPAPPPPGARFTQKMPFGLDEKFEMLPIKGGTFTMKDPKTGTAGEVTVKDFWLGKTEVTWDEYDLWRLGYDFSKDEKERTLLLGAAIEKKSRPSKLYIDPTASMGVPHPGRPVICVALPAAQLYAKWLSEKTGRKYRLPTEAEWEYACRAGGPVQKLTRDEVDKVAWFNQNCEEDGRPAVHPIAEKDANAWGLHDMLGNTGEWCLNPDGSAAVRGGSYESKAAQLTAETRAVYDPKWQADDPQSPKSIWWLSNGRFAGLRLVCDP